MAVQPPALLQVFIILPSESRHCSQKCAQVLLTLDNISIRNQYLNARNTLSELVQYGVVPIVNENDTVAVEELGIGDNDTLSAQVCTLTCVWECIQACQGTHDALGVVLLSWPSRECQLGQVCYCCCCCCCCCCKVACWPVILPCGCILLKLGARQHAQPKHGAHLLLSGGPVMPLAMQE